MKCIATSEGLFAQNYFRSHRVRWSDLGVAAIMPGGLQLPGGSYTNYAPEYVTKAGDRFWITALTNATVCGSRRFRQLVEERARTHGFDARVAWG